MSSFAEFLIGLLLGGAFSGAIAYFFLIRDHHLQESKYSESARQIPYAIDDVWEFLSDPLLINCCKSHESPLGDERDQADARRPAVAGKSVIFDRSGEAVFINYVEAARCLEYGPSPFQSTHFFQLFSLSSTETLIVLRRLVIPEDLLGLPFHHKLLSLFLKSPYQPADLASVTLDTIEYGVQKHNRIRGN